MHEGRFQAIAFLESQPHCKPDDCRKGPQLYRDALLNHIGRLRFVISSAFQSEHSILITYRHGFTLDAEGAMVGVPVILVNVVAAIASGAILPLPAILLLAHNALLSPTACCFCRGLQGYEVDSA